MNRLFSSLQPIFILSIVAIFAIPNVHAQSNDLYYNSGDRKIPLVVQTDSIARLVLPNETIVQFKPGISSIDRAEILSRHHFDPKSATELQFARGFYLVKATVRGLDVLTATNQLGKASGVQSSMPNFIQVQSTFDRPNFGIRKIGNPQKFNQ